MGEKYSHRVSESFAHSKKHLFLNMYIVTYFQAVCFIWPENGFRKHDHMFTCTGKSPLPKWPYGMWEEITFPGELLILLEKRYQQNPRCGFPTFQVTLSLNYFIGDAWMTTSYSFFTLLFLSAWQLEGHSGLWGWICQVCRGSRRRRRKEEADVA